MAEMEVVEKTKKRARPKTTQIRRDFKNRLEAALLSKKSPMLNIFKETDDGTELAAPISDVLTALNYSPTDPIRRCSGTQLRDVSNLSRVFSIVGDSTASLRVIFDSRLLDDIEDKTAYVDNIPPTCSADQLRRRAGVFGNVVNVYMPNVSRLKRRPCPGVAAPLNSGFAFIQYSSKVAARRFCKRYAANTHLNRTHHPKTHKKRRAGVATTSTTGVTGAGGGDSKLTTPEKPPANIWPEAASGDSANRPSSSAQLLGRRRVRRSTELSASGVDDSGTESDFTARPSLGYRGLKGANPTPKDTDAPKKIKKRRRRRLGEPAAFSLTKFLQRIQVYSFARYQKLRDEYMELKRERFNALRSELQISHLIAPPSAATVEQRARANGCGTPIVAPRRRRRRLRGDGNSTIADETPKKKHTRSRATVIKVAIREKDQAFFTASDD